MGRKEKKLKWYLNSHINYGNDTLIMCVQLMEQLEYLRVILIVFEPI